MATDDSGLSSLYFLYMGVGVSVFWLGLYALTRAWMLPEVERRTPYSPSLFIGISCILLGVYSLGVAMEAVALSSGEFFTWQRLTWWVTPFAATFFLFAVFSLDHDLRRSAASARYAFLFGGLLIVSAAVAYGIVSGVFSSPVATAHVVNSAPLFSTLPRMPHYLIYGVYVLGLLTIAAIRLIWRWIGRPTNNQDDANDETMWPLALAGGLILTGSAIGIAAPGAISRQLGLMVIAGGSGLTAYAMARHHAFMQSRSIVRDFRQSFLRTLFSLLIFVSLFVVLQRVAGYHPEPAAPAILSYLIVIMQMGSPQLFSVTDRLLLPSWMSRYRQQLERLQSDALTAIDANDAFANAASIVDEITEQAQQAYLQATIREEIERIFQYRHFEDDVLLNKSRLQDLSVVKREVVSDADAPIVDDYRANTLRRALIRLLDLSCAKIHSETPDPEEIGLMIMYKQYIENMSRSQVETFLQDRYGLLVRGGVYSRYLMRGRARFASILYRTEITMIENTPLSHE